MLSGLLDSGLDRSVLLGYANVGIELRRRLPGWPADPPRMDGRTVLVTGAASGLGAAAAIAFAGLGARVHVHGRSPERARAAALTVARAVAGADVVPEACDVSELAAIRDFTAGLAPRLKRLDVLVHNAGVMPPERRHSAEGHELMFATHVLATSALLRGLREPLAHAAPGRVIAVSSGGMYGQALPPSTDPESERAVYRPAALYAATKRQQVVIAERWAALLDPAAVLVHAMHPGWADTGGVREALPRFHALTRPLLRSPAQGADTIVWLGAGAEAARDTGGFWMDRRRRPTSLPLGPGPGTPAERDALWDHCERSLADAGLEERG